LYKQNRAKQGTAQESRAKGRLKSRGEQTNKAKVRQVMRITKIINKLRDID